MLIVPYLHTLAPSCLVCRPPAPLCVVLIKTLHPFILHVFCQRGQSVSITTQYVSFDQTYFLLNSFISRAMYKLQTNVNRDICQNVARP